MADPVATSSAPAGNPGAAPAPTTGTPGTSSTLSASSSVTTALASSATGPAITPTTTGNLGSPIPAPDPSPGTNSGAVAGAAIGCLVAGLLLGFALAAFLFRRKRQTNRVEPRAVPAAPPSRRGSEARFQLNKFLLDSNADVEISSELRSLDTLIQQHVENNYHLGPVQADPRALAGSLIQLGVGNGGSLTAETITQLALRPSTRHVALRHVISQVLFTSIDVSARSQLSMLPAPLAAFLWSIPQTETGDRNAKVTSLALNQWRTLSAFLLHPARSQRTPLPTSDAATAAQAAALTDALDSFLGYFAGDGKESRSMQRSHLQAVIGETTKFGYVLLSQPSEWRFVHEASPGQFQNQNQQGFVAVVCAGLVKVGDKDGKPFPVPQQVVAPSTVLV